MATGRSAYRYSVYVVEVSAAVWNEPRFRKANPGYVPGKPFVYVGMVPELYAAFNPMPHDGARDMEVELPIGLREAGYGVWQA